MMKGILLFVLFFGKVGVNAQQVNFCNYFGLDVRKTENNKKKGIAASPKIIGSPKDKQYQFFHRHQIRFEYILFKQATFFKK